MRQKVVDSANHFDLARRGSSRRDRQWCALHCDDAQRDRSRRLRGALAAAVAVMVYTAWHLSSAHGKAGGVVAALQWAQMKTKVALGALLFGTISFADGGKEEPLPKPCQAIATACEAAGFHRGGHKEGKGLWKDCVAPILDGKAISGVTVGGDDVKACQAKRPRDRG